MSYLFPSPPVQDEFGAVQYYPHGVYSPVLPTHVDPEALQVPPGAEYQQYEFPSQQMTTRLSQGFPGMYSTPMPSAMYYGPPVPTQGPYLGTPVPLDGAQVTPGAEYPHYVHVPVFRTRKRVYVKKQAEGCCGCINGNGYFDNPGGFACFPMFNIAGCLDRDMVVKVDRYGRPVKHKKTYTHGC